ncbi:hypothetical protein F2Q68_00044966 [Brassica cretica]|uniref:Uncharacterized protein n=1 Tax=Brassica cretica TaxID=69181 RepID=A0A8S9LSA7_BRACR|nr:hypothetical protein F2Q68_00044966 [Brassica cretica]
MLLVGWYCGRGEAGFRTPLHLPVAKEVKALKCPDESHRERVVQMRVLLFFLKSSVVRALLLSVRSKKTG